MSLDFLKYGTPEAYAYGVGAGIVGNIVGLAVSMEMGDAGTLPSIDDIKSMFMNAPLKITAGSIAAGTVSYMYFFDKPPTNRFLMAAGISALVAYWFLNSAYPSHSTGLKVNTAS